MNRYIGVWHTDPIPGSPKVALARRHIHLIDPEIAVTPIKDDILSAAALKAIEEADYVFGCVDNDGVRFFINEACVAYEKPLIDLASDVPEQSVFGGHVAIVTGGHGCLHCLELLDPEEVRRYFSPAELIENEAAVYGIKTSALENTRSVGGLGEWSGCLAGCDGLHGARNKDADPLHVPDLSGRSWYRYEENNDGARRLLLLLSGARAG